MFFAKYKIISFSFVKIIGLLAYIYWNIDPNVPLPFDFVTIQWYGVAWSLSIIGSFYIGKWILKSENLSEENLILILQYAFIGVAIGARLAHIFFYQREFYFENPVEMLKIWKGGLASHGGVVGAIGGLYAFTRFHREYSLLWLLDKTAIVCLIPAAVIRLGNLFNSELIGKQTDVPWAFVFERIDNIPRHPVVLYESIAYFILFYINVIIYRKYQSTKEGIFISLFFATTFTIRFFLEFFKEPDGFLLFDAISKTQLLNLPFILAGILAFFYFNSRKKLV